MQLRVMLKSKIIKITCNYFVNTMQYKLIICNWVFLLSSRPLSFIYLEKARQSFFSQTVEAKNMADFWRIMTPFDAIWRHFYGNG